MTRAPLFVLPLSLVARVLAAQSDASVGVGAGTVRYAGGSSFSSAAVSPTVEFDAPTFTASGNGTLASLPGGVWSTQGRGDAWAASHKVFRDVQLGGEAIAAGVRRSDGVWSAAAHAVGEVIWSGPAWGIALGGGPSAGWAVDSIPAGGQPSVSSVQALHFRARGWRQAGQTYASFSVEPTRFLGAWFTDVGTGVTLARGPTTATLWAQARLSVAYGSKAALSAALQSFVSPFVSLEVAGGGYLPDPYQSLPRAGYFTFAVRLHARRHAIHALAARGPPPLTATRGDSLVVRFHMSGATSVSIAGDWNAWKPAPLRPVGNDVWEGVLTLRAGVHHFNLLVDGTDWVVPHGVANVNDGLGGMVGVLIVQ